MELPMIRISSPATIRTKRIKNLPNIALTEPAISSSCVELYISTSIKPFLMVSLTLAPSRTEPTVSKILARMQACFRVTTPDRSHRLGKSGWVGGDLWPPAALTKSVTTCDFPSHLVLRDSLVQTSENCLNLFLQPLVLRTRHKLGVGTAAHKGEKTDCPCWPGGCHLEGEATITHSF